MNIKLVLTCGACPEQYDAIDIDTGKEVAYLRLRHGYFCVECPFGGKIVYEANPDGDGIFMDYERNMYLNVAIDKIKEFYQTKRKAIYCKRR